MFFIKQVQHEQGKLGSGALWPYPEMPFVVLHLLEKKWFFLTDEQTSSVELMILELMSLKITKWYPYYSFKEHFKGPQCTWEPIADWPSRKSVS